jgi:hypothetical protein
MEKLPDFHDFTSFVSNIPEAIQKAGGSFVKKSASALAPLSEAGSKFLSAMKSIPSSAAEMAAQLKGQTPFDMIGTGELSQVTPGEAFGKFDEKSNIPIDKVTITTAEGKTKKVLYADVDLDTRKELDEAKFEKIQNHFNHLEQNSIWEMTPYKKAGIDYEHAHVAEVLSKVLAYLHPDVIKGKTLSIPVKNSSDKLEMQEFTIKYEDMEGTKLPFLTLTPTNKDLEPWLIIRGTDANVIGKSADGKEKESSLQSVIADFIDPKGISNKPIDEALTQFEEKISKLSENGKKVNLAGHSLGGEFVQYLAVKLSEKRNENLGVVYGFNSPGVSKKTQVEYKNLKPKGNPIPKLINFNKVGDCIPGVGRKLIGTHYRIDDRRSASPDMAHRVCDLNRAHTLQEVDVEKEEKKGIRRLMEGARKNLIGAALRGALKISNDLHPADWIKSYLTKPELP